MARKLCTIPNCTRSIGAGGGDDAEYARSIQMCNPCATFAGWENTHSDNGHDDAGKADAWWLKKGTDPATVKMIKLEMTNCWVCHSDLDLSAKDHTPRTGHTNTKANGWTSHNSCHHARTPQDRAACRKAGGPGSEGSLALFPAPKKG